MPPRIGAHVGGGLTGTVTRALDAGAEAVQVFASNPRGWAESTVSEEADARVRAELAAHGIGPMILHAPYLVNIAATDTMFQAKSVRNAVWTLQRAAALGAAGVVVHAGSGGATSSRADAVVRAAAALLTILQACPPGPALIVELTAGAGNPVACRWSQAAELLDAANGHERIRFCFDTCHANSAGYDLATSDGAHACWEELGATVGIDRLALVHANDSRDPLGSKRDRHAHIGQGTIGEEGFRALLAHPFAQRVPWIVETPREGQAQDIARLRALATA